MSVIEFRLPNLGEGTNEAEVVKWLVEEGEQVQELEPMVEVQTDKAVVELPAPVTGYVSEIFVAVGAVVQVGDVLVSLQSDSEAPSHREPKESGEVSTIPAEIRSPNQNTNAHDSLLWKALRYAERSTIGQRPEPSVSAGGLDDDQVRRPYFPGAKAGASAAASDATPTRVPFRGVRRAMAEHVARSAFAAPHVTAFDECDATELVALRKRWNESLQAEGQRLSYLPFLIKATVSALKAFPYLNARLNEDAQEIELLPNFHIGIAVDTQEGTFVPVLRHADRQSVRELGEEIYRLTQGARTHTLVQEDLRGSTFTITNMGPIGGLFATPILNHPEVGILAVHQIARKPVARGEEVVIRDMLTLSLSFDHRVIDGATAVRFLNHIQHLVEHPDLLMLDLR